METIDRVLDLSENTFFIDIKEAAGFLGIAPATAMNWRWKGCWPIPTIKIGKKVCVRAKDLAAFLDGTADFSFHKTESASKQVDQKKRSPGRPRKMARAQGGVK